MRNTKTLEQCNSYARIQSYQIQTKHLSNLLACTHTNSQRLEYRRATETNPKLERDFLKDFRFSHAENDNICERRSKPNSRKQTGKTADNKFSVIYITTSTKTQKKKKK